MTYRRRNQSVAFRAAEAELLHDRPLCRCGEPAAEAHRGGGCCVNPPYNLAELEAVCRACHEETGCTAMVPTPIHRLLESL